MLEVMQSFTGIAELIIMLGVSRQRVHELTLRKDFPEPAASLRGGRIWYTADIEEWAAKVGRQLIDPDEVEE